MMTMFGLGEMAIMGNWVYFILIILVLRASYLVISTRFIFLGRGGSEGCKLPMRIDCLKGLRVIKVECGSQFSVALCQCGSVYTW